MYVFKVTNLLNSRSYTTYTSKQKINLYSLRSNKEFISDLKKLGSDNFSTQVISACSNKKEACSIINSLIKEDDYNTINIGFVVVKDGNDRILRVQNTDPRFLSGELKAITSGKVVVKDENGNKFSISKNDPRYLNGQLISIHKNKTVVKNKKGQIFYIDINDPRYKNELIHVSSGISPDQTKRVKNNISGRSIVYENLNKEIELVYQDDKRSYLIKDHCKHGDLNISPYILQKLYDLKFKTVQIYCEKCRNEFIENYHPSESEIEKNIDVYNDKILSLEKTYSSRYMVEESLKIYYPDIYKSILLYTQHYENLDWRERVYMFKNKIKNRPKCIVPNCQNEVYYLFASKKFTHCCDDHKNIASISSLEKEVLDFVKQSTKERLIENFKTMRMELDIYIPSLKLAIEFNGIYWHSDEFKEPDYHFRKWKICQDHEIKLITIWEDDWNYKQEIVKSIVLNALGEISHRIYARNCEIKQIDFDLTKDFLEQNHLQGSCMSSLNLGLFHNNELVSIMTFGKKRKILNQANEQNEYELLRFCNKINTSIVGGASKLFKHFLNEYSPNQIVSYANCDISNGNLYETLGFKLERHTGLNYWWVKDKRYHRSNFMKHKLVKEGADPNKTEDEIMRERGFFKIYGAGNLKFEFSNNITV